MPEGDTIAYAARRIKPILLGEIPAVCARHGSLRGWDECLAGRRVEAVEPYGKHLFIAFEGGLLMHSHLKMTGAWHTGREGMRWRRSPTSAWLVMRARGCEVVQFRGPVLELIGGPRARIERQVAALGPDILADEFDYAKALRRLREDDPSRPLGDALLDQTIVAGIGNIWKAEACWDAAVSPWRPVGEAADGEIVAVFDAARPRMADSARGGRQMRERHVYKQRNCPRCAGGIAVRGQGDNNRLTWWCPSCQR